MIATENHPPLPLADLIPDSQVIYERLDRLNAEAALLRRLLSVALRREREAERLAGKAVPNG